MFPKIQWDLKQGADILQAGFKGPGVVANNGSTFPVAKTFSPLPVLSGVEVYKAVAATLGLPQDILSTTLLVFTRLFSITPDPELLSGLRKEILASGTSSPKSAKEKAGLEAKALAVIAAADKGVVLSPEGLEAYAALPEGGDFSGGNRDPREQPRHFREKEEPEAGDIKDKFENFSENGENGHFFDFLNRIPGKNGRRWIVWPFNFASGGTELTVLVRLLIRETHPNPSSEGGLLIADISGPKRNWRFLLDNSGEGKLEADITVFPGLIPKESRALRKEMERFLGSVAAKTEVRIRNGEEIPSLAEKLGGEVPLSVNEEA